MLVVVALCVLARYQSGIAEAQNIEQLRKAAEQGDTLAQRELGDRYRNGEGVPEDYREAMKWYRKAAEQGDPVIQVTLGDFYRYPALYGLGVPQDYREAVKWYRKAAEQGNISAQFLLGDMYSEGEGVPRDYEEAVKWYRQAVKQVHKAAERGDASSQFQLGTIYQIGRGVPKHDREAVKWFRKAAERGLAAAQHMLAIYYERGSSSVAKDYSKAYAWLNLAAAQGHKAAAKSRNQLATRMTAEQIAQAQKISVELFNRIKASRPK